MRSSYRLMPVVIAATSILGVLSGCAKAPDEELAAAKAAVEAAQEVEADKYMPNNFQNVQKALASAEAEIALQEKAFVLSRKYGKAKRLLNNATTLATQMKDEVPAAKADMKARVEANLAAAQEIAEETRVDIRKAPRSKGKDVLAQMRVDIDAADGAIAQAAADLAAGDILGAAQKLGNAQRLMKKIADGLSTGGTDGLM
jgi:hypothetical protein